MPNQIPLQPPTANHASPFSMLAMFAVASVLLHGCAFLNRDNTPTLNWVRENMIPEEPPARTLALPVVYPVGLGAVAVDAMVVHPITVVDDAYDDAKDFCWTDLDWEEEYVTECASLPWRTGATPVVFGGSFIGRSLFDIPTRASEQREEEEARRQLEEAKTRLASGEPFQALEILDDLSVWSLRTESERNEVALLRLRASIESRRYDRVGVWEVENMLEKMPSRTREIQDLLDNLRTSDDPLARWTATRIDLSLDRSVSQQRERIHSILSKEESAAYRMNMLEWLNNNLSATERRPLRPLLERLGSTDPDSMVRSYARNLIERMENPGLDR